VLEFSVFGSLSPSELNDISTSKSCRTYERGETIFYSGDLPSGLFCVNEGKVMVYKVTHEGNEQIVRLAKAGDLLGYRSLISGNRYSAFAVTMEPSKICHIPKHLFLSLVSGSHLLSARMMSLLSKDVKAAEEQIVEMAYKQVYERVAETLLRLKEIYGLKEDQTTLNVRITREQLAHIVGTTTESVSRSLTRLKDDNAIGIQGQYILILDLEALQLAAAIDD
jgi:CRP/FNR family transcriptional regulator